MATNPARKLVPLLSPTDNKQVFSLIPKFLGYRSREEKTLLPYGWMRPGSHDVLIDITGRLKNRPGYTLDGAASTTITPIYAWYDWEEHKNEILHFRAYSGNLQFRYNGVWTTIKTGLGTSHIRFTNYWDNTEIENCVLFVDGSTNVYKWNGANTTYASCTGNTITKQGTTTWAEDGFYAVGNKKLWLAGIEYTYTGGEGTTTLTGVTPDPTLGTQVVGDLIYQSIVTTTSVTNVPATFHFEGISNLGNQIYYGSATNNNIYISAINNYASCAFTAPVRVVGEGAIATLRAPWVGFMPQEDVMYITAGKSQWYQTKKTFSSDNSKEVFDVVPLKTALKQAALAQEAINHDRDSIIILTNETRLLTLGRTLNIFGTPMMTDYSYPVALDFNFYDWTDSSITFWKSYVIVAVPKESKWLILNQTDPNNVFWEAPQTGAFSGFSIIDGDLYAHGYSIPETYKLFDGGTDNGHLISSNATFSYYDYGVRNLTKYFNEFWLDGYISANTVLKITYNLDLDGCQTSLNGTFYGNNANVVCVLPDDSALGKSPLGKNPLGGSIALQSVDPLPPFFNVIFTTPRLDFYRMSVSFDSFGEDFNWQLVSFGPLAGKTTFGNNNLKISLS